MLDSEPGTPSLRAAFAYQDKHELIALEMAFRHLDAIDLGDTARVIATQYLFDTAHEHLPGQGVALRHVDPQLLERMIIAMEATAGPSSGNRARTDLVIKGLRHEAHAFVGAFLPEDADHRRQVLSSVLAVNAERRMAASYTISELIIARVPVQEIVAAAFAPPCRDARQVMAQVRGMMAFEPRVFGPLIKDAWKQQLIGPAPAASNRHTAPAMAMTI